MQLTELSTRLDTVESSIKKDIRNILEILQQQQSITGRIHSDEISDKSRDESPQQIDENRLQRTQLTPIEKQNILMTSSYQRCESDFSFEQLQTQPSSHRLPTASTSQVHRSISQPECTNTATDKSLIRFVFYSSSSPISLRMISALNDFLALHTHTGAPSSLHSIKL